MPSVQPEWCRELTIQQQSVLFLAARGPDNISKSHPCKEVVRAYRGSVLVDAKLGVPCPWGHHLNSFVSMKLFAYEYNWGLVVDAYFEEVDGIPHHYHMHLMHGAEILGYKHPDVRYRQRWLDFYKRCCADMHVNPETEQQLDDRLNDWGREYWGNEASVGGLQEDWTLK